MDTRSLAHSNNKYNAAKAIPTRADVIDIPIGRLRPCPENEQLYQSVDPDSDDVLKLAASIAEHGVQESLVVTLNHYVLSGHRRLVASKLAKLQTVPCRYYPISYNAIGRGYSSIQPRFELAQRFNKTGKSKLVILFLSDFYPDGESIAEGFARSLRDDFGVFCVEPIKVALTADQVEELALPPVMTAKKKSSQYRKFTSKFGDTVFELEAVSTGTLQGILTKAIESVLNTELYNAEIEAERKDAGFLETARQQACRALAEMRGDS